MHLVRLVLGFSLFVITFTISAQDADIKRYTSSNKGKFFLSWGGNRGFFTKSDITFKGADYNFTLSDVKSHDKPQGWHVDYINPLRMTIPQTNAKIGYFISDKYSIALGVDHMKYIMAQNQIATINGNINLVETATGSQFNGAYNSVPIELTEEFLKFEHTDGLNFIYGEFSRFDDISSILNINNTDVFQVNVTEGIGFGILYPKTDTTLLLKERYDIPYSEYNVAGYGLSLSAGLHLNFFKHFFVRGDLKGGFIDMNNIRTTDSKTDTASQSFFYFQHIISIGGIFRI